MALELISGVIGGVIGGVLGVTSALLGAYFGPRWLEEWREQRSEERLHGPRKRLLRDIPRDERFPYGRTIETLSRVSGTTYEECRRLLIEIGARGVLLKGDREGWAQISPEQFGELPE